VLTGVRKQSFAARLLMSAIIILSLAGCSPTAEPTGLSGRLWKIEVGPDYKRPEVRQVGEFRSQLSPSEAASLADMPWWSVFKDPTLKELMTAALASNYDLQLATARVMQARAVVWVAASPLYPHLGYQAFAGRERAFVPLEQSGSNVTYDTFAGLFSAVWELDVWGRIRRSTEAARANLFAQEYIKRGVMLTLVSDVATGYFRLLELDRELSIAQESSKTYAKTLDLFEQRYKFGKDSKLPVARAQANYDSSIANIAALRRAIIQQENAVSVLLGNYPGPIGRGEVLAAQTMPAAPTGLTSDLLQRRPDILATEQTMVGANAQVGVAVANFFPRIGLSALYGGQGPNIDNVVEDSFSIWNIFGNVAGPIFQGGALLETYYAQQAFWDATIAQYKQTILIAFREVSDALIAQQTLVAQRESLVKQVASLKEAVALALLRYDAGRASYFEVLEAEQQLFPAEDALAQTERDQLLAVVDLYKALGGGWKLNDARWVRPN
jgi:multidrug efflux system outer membrane protein